MRPAKRILLLDGDEERSAVTRFTLWTWGYAPGSARRADLVLAYGQKQARMGREAARRLGCKVVVVLEVEPSKPPGNVAAWLVNPDAAALHEEIRLALVMKRGPKPHVELRREREAERAARLRRVAEEVRERRMRAGLSQRGLAQAANCYAATIVRIEAGEGWPEMATLIRVGAALGADVMALEGGA
jgi:DNA-binding XRE family transcriptional regulator